MTTKLKVAAGVAFLVLGVAGVAVIAQAQDGQEAVSRATDDPEHLFFESLGTGLGATDVWSVQCGAGTTRVNADVQDTGGADGVRITVTVINPQGRANSRTTDGGLTSDALLSGGAGSYLVVITRSLFGTAETYNTEIHCQNSLGTHFVTNVVLAQDQ
jgi:hypothetical protein